MMSYAFLIAAFITIKGQQIVDIPVTFYLEQLESAPIDAKNELYYSVNLCKQGVRDMSQAILHISTPGNVVWNTTAEPFVMVQISICKDSFTASCVLAQNYVWGIYVKAQPNISWDLSGNESAYYFRVMAGYEPSEFSMELSFANNVNTFAYPWTTNLPFSGTVMSKAAIPLDQYWKSSIQYQVPNNVYVYFVLAYCDQGHNIQGVNVALSTPVLTGYSLVQQWACPQTVRLEECTASNSQSVGWYNPHVASFNILTCNNRQSASTTDGIYIVVSGGGANIDEMNTFILYASIYTPAPSAPSIQLT